MNITSPTCMKITDKYFPYEASSHLLWHTDTVSDLSHQLATSSHPQAATTSTPLLCQLRQLDQIKEGGRINKKEDTGGGEDKGEEKPRDPMLKLLNTWWAKKGEIGGSDFLHTQQLLFAGQGLRSTTLFDQTDRTSHPNPVSAWLAPMHVNQWPTSSLKTCTKIAWVLEAEGPFFFLFGVFASHAEFISESTRQFALPFFWSTGALFEAPYSLFGGLVTFVWVLCLALLSGSCLSYIAFSFAIDEE